MTQDISYQYNKSGDLLLILSKSLLRETGFRLGDTINIEPHNNKLILTPTIRISRLKREWNKYMRRIKADNESFDVYRSEKCIGRLDSKNISSIKPDLPYSNISNLRKFNEGITDDFL